MMATRSITDPIVVLVKDIIKLATTENPNANKLEEIAKENAAMCSKVYDKEFIRNLKL